MAGFHVYLVSLNLIFCIKARGECQNPDLNSQCKSDIVVDSDALCDVTRAALPYYLLLLLGIDEYTGLLFYFIYYSIPSMRKTWRSNRMGMIKK